MATIHPTASISPGKQELLAAWLPTLDDWPGGEVPAWAASFRFDDPDGEVGIETFLFLVGDHVVHAPLTYRGAPLDGGTLITEMDHTVLGRRWIYDATTDPVYRAVTTSVIRDGGHEVDLTDGTGAPVPRRPTTASVHGSGTGIDGLQVAQLVSGPAAPAVPAGATGTLTATWPGHESPVVLAWLTE